ncbi:MAG: hypothetical protein HZB41_13335 [Ignavibacteriae bacterium]|nr:hypothetical protein [Ignavibacteriota bacterium]
MNNKRTYYKILFIVIILLLGNPLASIQTNDENDYHNYEFIGNVSRNLNLLKSKINLKKYLKIINDLKTKDYDDYKYQIKELTFLEAAYRMKSYEMLKEFLDAFAEESAPFDSIEYQSKPQFEKEAYNIFYKIFKPLDIGSILRIPKYNNTILTDYNFYSDKKYLIIQDKVPIELYQEETHKGPYSYSNLISEKDTIYLNVKSKFLILGFNPSIFIKGYKIIFCSNDFSTVIKEFLGKRHHYNSLKDEFIESKEFNKRLDFINHFITIITSFHADFYRIETNPLIENISLNFNYTEARVYTWINDRSITLRLIKNDRVWEIIDKSEIVY